VQVVATVQHSSSEVRPKKRKIGMVADLLKPIDAERNAALEAEIVQVHGKKLPRTGSWKLKTPNCVARTRNLKQG
jgi:hypothetical protein